MFKIVRVEVEFDDGKINRLTGEEAENWRNACEAVNAYCANHGRPFPRMNWETFIREPSGTQTRNPQGA